jgi:hypothetical protein
METPSSPSPEESLPTLTRSVRAQLAAGQSRGEVVQQLVGRGWPLASARQFVANAANGAVDTAGEVAALPLERHPHITLRRLRVLRGALLIVLGVCIAAGGLALSDSAASLYLFAVGVILGVFGLLDFLFGLSA